MKLNRFFCGLLMMATTFTYAQEAAIVGGIDAEEEEFPWMVQLLVNNQHICGGSLIAPQWVLTAAHCSQDDPLFGLIPPEKVIINSININTAESYSEEVNVESVFNYPAFDLNQFDLGNDLSLLKLETPVTSIDPVAIHSVNGNAVQLGDSLLVMGWGSTDNMGTQSSTLLYSYPTAKEITDVHIFAGYDSTETVAGAGAGDSGGPLLKTIDGVLTQVGIVSGGEGIITEDGSPGYYTRVYQFAHWIDSVMAAESGEPVGLTEWSDEVDVTLSSDILIISTQTEFHTPVSFELVDLKGRRVYANTLQSDATFNVNHLNTGLYFFRMVYQNEQLTKKLIKL